MKSLALINLNPFALIVFLKVFFTKLISYRKLIESTL